jgi:hypothetical protein
MLRTTGDDRRRHGGYDCTKRVSQLTRPLLLPHTRQHCTRYIDYHYHIDATGFNGSPNA